MPKKSLRGNIIQEGINKDSEGDDTWGDDTWEDGELEKAGWLLGAELTRDLANDFLLLSGLEIRAYFIGQW